MEEDRKNELLKTIIMYFIIIIIKPVRNVSGQ
jgi:hypothetical protein